MRICATICAVVIVAAPAAADDIALGVDLLPGHPVHHEALHEAGAVMAIVITPGRGAITDLQGLCEELRLAAGLRREWAAGLPLEVVFVVPYKGMAVEGYYLPADGQAGSEALVRGSDVPRAQLDDIVARAGIPSGILDERDVEQEVSCTLAEPTWLLNWQDVRPIGDEPPDAVIDRAYQRFQDIHRSVIEHVDSARIIARLGRNAMP